MEVKGRLRFPTNRSLIWYFLRGSLPYFVAGAVCACLVALFDLIIPRLIQYTVDAVIGNGLSTVPAWAAGTVERLGGADFLRAHLWAAALAVAAAAALGALCRYGFQTGNEKGAEVFVERTRNELFSQILSLPYAWQAGNSTGDIIQRCTSDVETIKIFVSEQLTSLLRVFVLVFMSLYFMAAIQWRLMLAAAVFIPIMVGSSLLFHGLVGDEFEKVDSEEGRLSAIAQENLTGVRVVRTFGREKFERGRFEKQNEVYTGHWIRLMKILAAFWVSGNVIATVRNMTVAVFGAVLCVRGQLTAGGLIAFLSYNALMSLPVRSIGRVIADMSKAGVSMERLRYIMNAEPEEGGDAWVVKNSTEGGCRPFPDGDFVCLSAPGVSGACRPALDGDIVFSDVRFRYGKDLPWVLDGVSMTIRAGKTVGILGATGSGKSTMMLLLDRLYELEPGCGTITVGGIDIRSIDRGWLRQKIGMVLQEPYLFSRTLKENIAIAMKGEGGSGTQEGRAEAEAPFSGKTGGGERIDTVFGEETASRGMLPAAGIAAASGEEMVSREVRQAARAATASIEEKIDMEVRQAARTACLDEAVARFADGYDTFVGERGVTLSGGQKQRAAIARMLVRHTPIMIFDDSLSAVDAETDEKIRRALRKDIKGATVILIAHRITTLQQADEIFVLDGGRIAERGTHEELIGRRGLYRRVYELQAGEG